MSSIKKPHLNSKINFQIKIWFQNRRSKEKKERSNITAQTASLHSSSRKRRKYDVDDCDDDDAVSSQQQQPYSQLKDDYAPFSPTSQRANIASTPITYRLPSMSFTPQFSSSSNTFFPQPSMPSTLFNNLDFAVDKIFTPSALFHTTAATNDDHLGAVSSYDESSVNQQSIFNSHSSSLFSSEYLTSISQPLSHSSNTLFNPYSHPLQPHQRSVAATSNNSPSSEQLIKQITPRFSLPYNYPNFSWNNYYTNNNLNNASTYDNSFLHNALPEISTAFTPTTSSASDW